MIKGGHHSEESKARIRAHLIGRTRSEETKQKISDGNRKNHPFKGKHLSDEHRARIRASLLEFHKKRNNRG